MMKKIILFLFAIGITTMSSVCMAGMSTSKVRKETRFLTDKMAYELNLSNAQYNDIYEINFDFLYSIRNTIDYVAKGYQWAMNDYYDALDVRNDDLRWVLNNSQYRRFMNMDYFYRPIYVTNKNWSFRVYNIYVNRNHFYYPKPHHYQSYCGANWRPYNSGNSYYKNRHKHDSYYSGNHSVRNERVYQANRRSDFGSVTVRPNTSTRPSNMNNSSTRPSSSSSSNASTRPSTSTSSSSSRPSNNSNSSSNRESSSNRGSSNSNRGNSNSSSSSNSGSSNRRSESTSTRSNSSSTSTRSSNSGSSSTSTRSSSSTSRRSSDNSTSSDSNSSSSSRRSNTGR